MKKLLGGLFILSLLLVGTQVHASTLSDAILRIQNLEKEVAQLKASLQGAVAIPATSRPFVPIVISPTVTNITSTSATIGATVTSLGSPAAFARSMCIDTTSGSTGCSTTGVALGTFYRNVTGLTPGTTYYFKGSAIGPYGTGWSPVGTFKTLSARPFVPIVISPTVTNITSTSATIGATVTSLGSPAATASSMCIDKSTGTTGCSTVGVALGSISRNVTGLTPGTTYYFKGSAISSYGTGWSPSGSFKTLPAWVNVGTPGFSTGGALGNLMSPSFILDSNNVPYVAYADNTNSFQIKVMKFNGTSWVNVGTTSASFAGSLSQGHSIAIGPNNTPYIAYSDYGSNSYKATVRKFDGTNWIVVGNPGFSAGIMPNDGVAITFDSTKTIPYVAYKDGNTGTITVKKFDGVSWVNVGNPGFSAGRVQSVVIALDSINTPYVAYRDGGNSSKMTVMKFNGTSWVNVGNPGFSVGIPFTAAISLTFDSNNIPYIGYISFNGYQNLIDVIKFNGTSWVNVGNIIPFSRAGIGAGEIALDLDSNNVPYVVYLDPNPKDFSQNKATCIKFDGTNWVNVGNPDFSAGTAVYLSISLDSNNVPYVSYADGFNGNRVTVMKYQ